MVFSSIMFLCVFLPLVVTSFYIVPKVYRKYILIVFSLIFFSWNGLPHFWLLIASIAINFIFVKLLEKFRNKAILVIGVSLNVLLLLTYKYAAFLLLTLSNFISFTQPDLKLGLPLGISFFTFQAISILVDVFRKKTDEKINLTDFVVYMTFFPKLVSGPITPFGVMKTGLESMSASYADISAGLMRFSFGLAKKTLVADPLGQVTDNIWAGLSVGISPTSAWLAAITYSLQLYIDFMSYSDMAIGLGKVFGIELLENFNFPYVSRSITEFWRRWHMSLSTWFKNYLYIPMGGNKRGNVYIHLATVFLVTGLWHGANFTFIVWGLWHGIFIIIERLIKDKSWYIKIPDLFKWFATLLIVFFGWILFKAANLNEAFKFIEIMFGQTNGSSVQMGTKFYIDNKVLFTIAVALSMCFPTVETLKKMINQRYPKIEKGMTVFSQIISILLLILSFMFIINSTYSPFIYFQF